MEKHIHEIGIKLNRSTNIPLCCGVCGKHFRILEAMNYLETYLGMKQGVEYWRKLRYMRDEIKIERKRGIEFSGFWIPE